MTASLKKRQDIEKKDESPTIPISTIVLNDQLYEEVYCEGKYFFCCLTDKGFKFFDRLCDEKQGVYYVPQIGEEIPREIVLLPSVPSIKILVETLKGDGSGVMEVLTLVREFIHKYCDLPRKYEELLPFWILGTYIYDKLDQFPILSFQGDMGTGKSRCKDVLGSICYTPIRCNGGISPPAMYRLIDKWRGTMLIDEADFKASDTTTDMIKLLNCGFERRNPIAKCDLDNNFKLLFFNAYCPKIVTRRNEWSDKATESRCINIISQQTNRKELPIVLPPTFEKDALNLRNQLIGFRLGYWQQFSNPIENPLKDLDIEPRLAQTCTSLAIVVSPFKEAFESIKNIILEMQAELIDMRANTVEGALVMAYNNLKEMGQEFITPTELAVVASDIYSEDIGTRSAGKHLKSLGFESRVMKRDKKSHKNVLIDSDRWLMLKKRYLVTTVTTVTLLQNTMIKRNHTRHDEKLAKLESSHAFDVTNVTVVTNVTLSDQIKALLQICHSFAELKDKLGTREDVLMEQLIYLMSVGDVYQPRPDHYEVLK